MAGLRFELSTTRRQAPLVEEPGTLEAVARLAVTGTNVGPSITGIFHVLGRERTVRRLEKFLATV